MDKHKIFQILSIALFLVGYGCSRNQSDSTFGSVQNGSPAMDSTRLVNDSHFHPLACEIMDDFPESVNKINGNGKAVLSGYDGCVQDLLDSLASRFILSKDLQYIAVLDSLARMSDGYVSDYLCGISYNIFMNALPAYIAYMEKIEYDSKLRQLLVYGLKEEVDVERSKGESVEDAARRKEEKLNEVRSVVNDAQTALSSQEKKYLVDILIDTGIR